MQATPMVKQPQFILFIIITEAIQTNYEANNNNENHLKYYNYTKVNCLDML